MVKKTHDDEDEEVESWRVVAEGLRVEEEEEEELGQ